MLIWFCFAFCCFFFDHVCVCVHRFKVGVYGSVEGRHDLHACACVIRVLRDAMREMARCNSPFDSLVFKIVKVG